MLFFFLRKAWNSFLLEQGKILTKLWDRQNGILLYLFYVSVNVFNQGHRIVCVYTIQSEMNVQTAFFHNVYAPLYSSPLVTLWVIMCSNKRGRLTGYMSFFKSKCLKMKKRAKNLLRLEYYTLILLKMCLGTFRICFFLFC